MSGLRLKPWLALALIFVVGIVTGVALTMGMKSHWMRPPSSRQMQHHWLEHLTERLSLTTDQQAKVKQILESAGDQIKTVHRDEMNRMSAIFQSTDAQITPLLTADQQSKFASLQAERQREFSHHTHHGDAPPPDHPAPPDSGPGPDKAPPPPPPGH